MGLEKDKGGYAGNYAPSTLDGASQYARTLESAKLSESTAKALEGAAAYVLAAWKGGELLMGLDKAGGMGGDLKSSGHVDRTISQYARALDAAKLSESTAKRWQRIARALPLEAVEQYLRACFEHAKLSAQTKNRTGSNGENS